MKPSSSHAFLLGCTALGCLLATAPAGNAQDQTWYGLGGNFVGAGDHWGESVALVPDVNGDGHAEMLIGAPQDAGNGSAYLINGNSPHILLKQFHGDSAGSTYGQVVAVAGLVDGDSVPDLLVSAPRADIASGFQVLTDAGRVTLYNGATNAVLRTFQGGSAGARFGDSIASNADVSGDGIPDILIGAPHWDKTATTDNEGYANLYNGATGTLLMHHEGLEEGDLFGWSVALVGDLTGDGRSEYAIGAPGENFLQLLPPKFAEDGGSVTVYDGSTHAVLFKKFGGNFQGLGTAVCGVGDTDGDGVREVLMGAPGIGDPGFTTGLAQLHEGAAGTLVRTYFGANFGEHFGTWLCKAGDLDKDGFQDVAIGGTEADVPSGGGFVRVFDGEDGSQLEQFDFLTGSGVSQHASFDGGLDVNGDGWPDLLVGLPDSDVTASNAGGAVCFGQLTYQGDLGFQGPHTPKFSIFGGVLESGNKADFLLTGAPTSGGAGFLLLSAGFSVQPFKGGTLIPKLAGSLFITFPVLPGGTLSIPGIPGGSGPINLYAQFIVSGYPTGEPIGLSNALVIVLKP